MIGTVFTTPESKKTYKVIDGHRLFGGTWKCYPIERVETDNPLKQNLIDCFSTDFIEKSLRQNGKSKETNSKGNKG